MCSRSSTGTCHSGCADVTIEHHFEVQGHKLFGRRCGVQEGKKKSSLPSDKGTQLIKGVMRGHETFTASAMILLIRSSQSKSNARMPCGV
jgi:hypothetical protein